MLIKSKKYAMKEKIADYITKTTDCTVLPKAVTKLSDHQTGMDVYAVQTSTITILAHIKDEVITIRKCNW